MTVLWSCLGVVVKISKIRIQNFRTFHDVEIPLNNYTCLVGPNGAGKSTILCALNIFFRETAHSPTDLNCLQEQDFHQRSTSHPITITITFTGLTEEAKQDFSDYVRQEELVVSAIATFDDVTKSADVIQFGQRKGMVLFKPFFKMESEGKPVSELKKEYELIQGNIPDLPKPGTKAQMIESLRTYESSHPDLCELIPSRDQFYGWSRGTDKLSKYIQGCSFRR